MKWISDSRLEHLRHVALLPDFSGTKYELVRELATGGMGTVYLAQDRELRRQVAIKVLNASATDDDSHRRTLREAHVIARLEHPGIIPVHDVGTLPDGRVYYAMKYVRGQRLDEYVRDVKSIQERLRKFQSVCDAVAFAHSHGVVHRDLKPQNIMVGSFGEVLVLDWGVAKIVNDVTDPSEADTLRISLPSRPESVIDETTQGTIIGTRNYMSPEQARGYTSLVDQRSDVFSLGVILYYLLTNEPPPHSGSFRRPRQYSSHITKQAEAVCLRAMADHRSDRYASANELAEDIGRLVDGNSVSAYREGAAEKLVRWAGKNKFLILLVLSYLLMRIILAFSSGR